jgi:hypothetical protein
MISKYINPINGDPMTREEWFAWKLQGVIRRWEFLAFYSLATLTCWVLGGATVLLWWNFCSSYLAIFVEQVVGRATYSVTKTDSAVIREIRKLGKQDTEHSVKDYAIDVETHDMVRRVLEILESK